MTAQPVTLTLSQETTLADALTRPTFTDTPDALWREFETLELDAKHLARHRVPSWAKSDPTHLYFDYLRTLLMKAMRENGWRRLGVTSATKGCGKTTVTTNLAFSFARQRARRTLLIDFDLRAPQVAARLGQTSRRVLTEYLSGSIPTADYAARATETLAVILNSESVDEASEIIQDPKTASVLAHAQREIAADTVLFDLPPIFGGDEAIASLPFVDCVLVVAAAGETTVEELEELERMVGDANLIGVILNKCHPSDQKDLYKYAQY